MIDVLARHTCENGAALEVLIGRRSFDDRSGRPRAVDIVHVRRVPAAGIAFGFDVRRDDARALRCLARGLSIAADAAECDDEGDEDNEGVDNDGDDGWRHD